jgi:hypothetical protein
MVAQFSWWSLPLAGLPCAVCGRPARILLAYADGRVVEHVADGPHDPACRIADPRPLTSSAPAAGHGLQPRAA